MRHTIIWFFAAAVFIPVSILFALLYIPPVGCYAVEASASHFLKHRLRITAFHITPEHIYLDGVFDDNGTMRFRARHLLTSERNAQLRLRANARLFSALARSALPDVDLNVTARYLSDRLRLDGTLLGGTLNAEMNLTTRDYRYSARTLRAERLLQAFAVPRYATGSLFAEGSGNAAAPYPQQVSIISDNIIIDEALLSRIGLKPKRPLRAELAYNAAFRSGHLLENNFSLTSTAFSVTGKRISYDLESGAFSLPITLENHSATSLPFRQLELFGTGSTAETNITADVTARFDGLAAILNNINIDPDRKSAAADYRLSSATEKPINLHGENSLFGTLSIEGDRLAATAAAKSFESPIALRYRDGNLSVISNNIPLNTLLDIANLPPLATGKIDLNASVSLQGTRPKGLLRLYAKTLMPAQERAGSLGMTRPGALRLEAFDTQSGYTALLDLASQPARTKKPAKIFYNINKETLRCDASLWDIALPGYRTKRLDVHSRFDLRKRLLLETSLVSPFERVDIPFLSFSGKREGNLRYRLTHPERFAPDLNATYVLEGNGTLLQEKNATRLSLENGALGSMQLAKAGPSLRLDADHVETRALFRLLNRPALLDGKLSLHATLGGRQGTAVVRAAELTPQGNLQRLLRPFPLKMSLDFSRDSDRFSGEGSLQSGSDRIALSSFEFNRSEGRFGGRYHVTVADQNRSALILPPPLNAPVTCSGQFEADAKRQHLTLKAETVLAGTILRRYLDRDAAAPLPVNLSLDAIRSADNLVLEGGLRTELFALAPLRLHYDSLHAHLALDASVLTDLWLGNSTIRFGGTLKPDGRLSDGSLSIDTASHDLNLTGLYADAEKEDYRADLSLSLQPLSKQARKRPPALLHGSFRTQPTFDARIQTRSFDGRLSALMNEELLIVHAEKLSLYPLLTYLRKVPYLKSGTLDAEIILDAQPLLAIEPGRLNGGIDLRLQNIRLEGVDLDSHLSTLRNTQDLSLFRGSLWELPIIRSIREIPAALRQDANISTAIPQARLAASIRNGVLSCEDCAAATTRHRFAFAGDINVTSQRFSHFYFALLNPEGCPYFLQSIEGELTAPRINLAESGINVIGGAVVSLASNVTDAAAWLTGIVHFVTTVTGEVIAYVPIAGRTTGEVLTGVSGTLHDVTKTLGGCIPFYLGSVPPPEQP